MNVIFEFIWLFLIGFAIAETSSLQMDFPLVVLLVILWFKQLGFILQEIGKGMQK